MKTFFASSFLFLIATVAFNFWVDASGIYWRRNDVFPADILPNQVIAVPGNRNERSDRIDFLKIAKPSTVLVLGSSRSLQVDQAFFPKSEKILNLSVSTVTAEELSALWQAALDSGQQPTTLVLFLDPWIINKNARGGDSEWLSATPYLARFCTRRNIPECADLFTVRRKFDLKKRKVLDLLNANVAWESLRFFGKFGWPRKIEYSLKTLAEMEPGQYGLQPDGAVVYPKDILALRTPEYIEADAKRVPEPKSDYVFMEYEESEFKKKLLKEILADAEGLGVRVLPISSPFHPVTYQRLNSIPPYPEYMKIWAQFFRTLPHSCDVTNPAIVNGEKSDFMDSSHMSDAGIEKVLKKCLNQ